MSSSTYIRASHFQIHKAVFSSPRPEHDVYMLSYVKLDGEKQWIPLVHVSKKLQQLFETGEVTAVEVHRLPQNCVVMKELPAQPERIATAVETENGIRIVDFPESLSRLRETRVRWAMVSAACALAGAMFASSWALVFLVFPVAFLRAAHCIPVRSGASQVQGKLF